MVTYELFINGHRCDLADDSTISLMYRSPLFADLDTIQSNQSITIELPLTRRNRKAVGLSMRPDVLSEEPFIKLPAELYADGVDVFRKGFAIIDEITDVIACTLVFGNIENFEALGETELREIEMAGDESISWDSQTLWDDMTPGGGVQYIRADFGAGVVNPSGELTGQPISMELARPSAHVPAILRGIEKSCGVEIKSNPDYFDISNLWVPITGQEPWEGTPAITTENIRGYFFVQQNGIAYYGEGSLDSGGVVRSNGRWDWIDISEVSKFRFRYRIQKPLILNHLEDNYIFSLWLSDTQDIDESAVLVYQETWGLNAIISNEVEIDTNKKRNLIIRVYGGVDFATSQNQVNGTFAVFGDFPNRKVLYPLDIPTAPNLPDMTCAEFLQNLMNMFGLFARAEGTFTVRLVHPAELYDRIVEGVAKDWSDKLVINSRGEVAEPEAVRFYIDDWAQVTTLDYDNDDEVVEAIERGDPETSGEIVIENKNIDKEGEVVIDFSASIMKEQHIYGGGDDTKAEVAVIPIWEVEGPDSEGNFTHRYSDVKPRILVYEYDTEDPLKSRLTFPKSMRFGGDSGIVSTHYKELQKILNRARIITVSMRLTPLDLRDMDFSQPIYLRQFGHYFAVYGINTDPSGISEVELIKL